MTGGWTRDLTSDLEAIHSWGARALVSLMEEDELLAVGIRPAEVACRLENLAIEWIHAPIMDGSVPDEAFMIRWRSMVPRLRSVLSEGGGIVFHCLGGLGRTGMMAACLLIEEGVAPADAIAIVRAARPGAIENVRQENFVMDYLPIRQLQHSQESTVRPS